jgi:hypothetical protein
LKAELINSYLYASDEFLHSLKNFIQDQSNKNLLAVAVAIRKDLWGLRTRVTGKRRILPSKIPLIPLIPSKFSPSVPLAS